MASAGDEENDAVLSDVEADDPVPVIDIDNSSSLEDLSVEKFREVLAELDRERQAREAAENAKSELQVSFNRLKVLAHEAIKKRDDSSRQRDEALREKEEVSRSNDKLSAELAEKTKLYDEVSRSNDKLSAELAEKIKFYDEVSKQRDELARKVDDTMKLKDSSRSEIETAAQMFVSGIEKISGKVSNFKDFRAGGLPRSQKYSGLPAVAYGVIKRTNEIVEELLRQIESTSKSRDEAREQMEQRNYEIAIEVSQLEATISGLREEVSKKASLVESLEKELSEKQNLAAKESYELRQLVDEYEDKLRSLELKMETQRPLLIDQLNSVSRIHGQICSVIKIVDANKLDHSDLSESLFLPRETDSEENIRASLAGLESISELSRTLVENTRDVLDEKTREIKRLGEAVAQSVKEKEHVGSLLRSVLSRRMSMDLSSKTNELFRVAENGLREAGIDYKFSNHLVDGKVPASNDKMGTLETEDDEIRTLAGALENIIKQSQLEIIELQHSVDELRAEASLLKEHVEAQAKELNLKRQRVEELEEKEIVANENVGGLMMDIVAAEEEIMRWKLAAQQEADAGKAVEQEYLAQLSALRQELEEANQAVTELEKKLKFKEETAAAAMAARDAAEKSLRLADLRASRLRDRVEELTHQLEELDRQENPRSGVSRPRYVCWPWQWLGMDFVGFSRSETQQQSSNEMELSEPLI